ncbi:site-specific integrase [Bradyrhizobium sp.]|uniref:site-specific integrase n=1 Tax=Bradyrhizobium sp. TaxID=376 RepID=UPI001EC0D5F4|nr:site-specific integrase [Bradyrhizobium sp.]MBV9985738.1 site-specific integrase [Bradyrhizobium sp.]
MTETSLLIETSFAQAIAIIGTAQELPEQTRRHWATSMRQVGKALDKPLEVIPARYSAVRNDMAQLHSAPLGLTPKTLQNHKSNVKSALLWLAREKGVPEHGAPLAPGWERLRAKIADRLVRCRLSSLMRFCSANEIEPANVDEVVVDRFIAYRAQIGMSDDDAFRRLLARAWNSGVGSVHGWPACRLVAPLAKPAVEVAWEQFPEGLRWDVDEYLQSLTRVRRSRTGKRIRPLKASTLRQRRTELEAAARVAVKAGVPVETLDSLRALLAPDVAEKILDAYWRRNGDEPKRFTVTLAGRFLTIARETGCREAADLERLNELREHLQERQQGGLTEKNIAFIRQVMTPGVWQRVINLPLQMMAAARSSGRHMPIRAAVTAQIAVAIAILTAAPVRLANLTRIRLTTNLIKPDGPDSNYWLVFPDYDVKNRVRLEYPLERYLTQLIDEYVDEFRPALLRGRNEDWLFPGQRAGAKGMISFSGQITKRIYEATGLRMTVHQFRHAAGALILQHRPGEYELVRRLLGHRSVQTTVRAYIGLENIQASKIFGQIVKEHMADILEAAE